MKPFRFKLPSVYAAVPIHRAWSHESQDYFMHNVQAAKSWRLHTLSKLYEESLIQRARNTLLDQFLATDADYLFFLDDDVVLIHDDSIGKLVRAACDIIGAVHVTKKPPYRPTFRPLDETVTDGLPYDLRGLTKPVEVKYVGTGAMLIARRVALRLKERYGYPFDCLITKKGEYLSEDWTFCERARLEGFKIFVEPTIDTAHLGVYAYSMNDYYAYNEGKTNGKSMP